MVCILISSAAMAAGIALQRSEEPITLPVKHHTFEMDVAFTDIEPTMTIYQVKSVSVSEMDVEAIGRLLGFNGGAGVVNDGVLGMVEGTKAINIYTASGAIWYADTAKLFRSVKKQPNLPSDAEAMKIAETFLSSRGLLPSDAVVSNVVADEQGEINTSTKEVSNVIKTDLQVIFERKKDNIPVIGHGSKLKVYIGDDGEVIGVYKAWRALEPYSECTIKTPEVAFEDLKAGKCRFAGPIGFDKAIIKEILLAYYVEAADKEQDFVEPVYVFKGELLFGEDVTEFEALVSAVL